MQLNIYFGIRQAEVHLCTAVELPRHRTSYIVAFDPRPVLGTEMHFLISICERPDYLNASNKDAIWQCMGLGGSPDYPDTPFAGFQCSQKHVRVDHLYMWARGNPKQEFPLDIGFKIGKGSKRYYAVLAVHYRYEAHHLLDKNSSSHPTNAKTPFDSGIILHLVTGKTAKRIKKSANAISLATFGIIPPYSMEHMEAACPLINAGNHVLYPFGFQVHTHGHGTAVTIWKIDPLNNWRLIGRTSPQTPQLLYPVESVDSYGNLLTLTSEDRIAFRCTMNNTRNSKMVAIGDKLHDEMCSAKVLFYTKDRPIKSGKSHNNELEEGELLTELNCASAGPPLYYWYKDPFIRFVPSAVDLRASLPDESAYDHLRMR